MIDLNVIAGNDAIAVQPPVCADDMVELGLAAASGRDSAPDLVTAHKWFNLAAMRGMPEARDLRAELAGQMTKDDVAEALKQARAWLATHAPSKVVLAA